MELLLKKATRNSIYEGESLGLAFGNSDNDNISVQSQRGSMQDLMLRATRA